MIKFILVGIWLCAVTLGSAYGVMSWRALQVAEETAAAKETGAETEQIRTKMISVPLMVNGVVHGYVLAQFTFSLDARLMRSLPVKPDLYLVDEAFRMLYSGEAVDFKTMRKADVGTLGKMLKENVNKRFGSELVRDVFVQELNYLPKEQFRGGTPKT